MFKKPQHLRWVIVGFAVVVLFQVAAIENIAAEKWEVISQLPTRRSGFSTAVVDGKIYIIGGTLLENRKTGPLGLSTVEVYDPENNIWRRVADMPTPRTGSEAAVVDGKIYVVGGYAAIDRFVRNSKFPKVVEVYDPQTDTWQRKQDILQSRSSFGIGVVHKKIYVIGGANLRENPWRLDHVEVYDPDTDSWQKRANLSTERSGFETAVVDDSIYVFGGKGWPPVFNKCLSTIEVYQPKINRWRKKADIPTLKTGFSTVVVAGKIYLIGGHGGVAFEEYLTTVEVYNPRTERWQESTPMPTGNTPLGVAAINGKIYMLGSERKNKEFSLDIEVFDTGFRAVTAVGKMSTRWGELKAEHVTQP